MSAAAVSEKASATSSDDCEQVSTSDRTTTAAQRPRMTTMVAPARQRDRALSFGVYSVYSTSRKTWASTAHEAVQRIVRALLDRPPLDEDSGGEYESVVHAHRRHRGGREAVRAPQPDDLQHLWHNADESGGQDDEANDDAAPGDRRIRVDAGERQQHM
eukprot:7385567-Prymnesium_polylepis.2